MISEDPLKTKPEREKIIAYPKTIATTDPNKPNSFYIKYNYDSP
jgi:hypothetical protein